MSVYGDGSDGVLNVTSGSSGLALDVKHQFSSVNIASGATLTTGSTSGAVLYICCTGSFTLNGTLDVSNKVIRGNNSWSVTIDGVLYSSPGVANGGSGGSDPAGGSGGSQGSGYGGGGSGGSASASVGATNRFGTGGQGGTGSSSASSGGASVSLGSISVPVTSSQTGGTGSSGAGGSGGAATVNGSVGGSGAGGSQDAVGNDSGGGGTTANSAYAAGGGGGGGGLAGKAGVHIVIKAPSITINGTIITSGSVGTDGKTGGSGSVGWGGSGTGYIYFGAGGGGGGGGNAGSVNLTYSFLLSDTATKILSGASGSAGGAGRTPNPIFASTTGTSNPGATGSSGSSGSFTTEQSIFIESGASGGGEVILEYEFASTDIFSGGTARGVATYVTIYQGLAQKEYEYRVKDGEEFIAIWQNVESEFGYSQQINQNATELNVTIARSPDNRVVKLDRLQDHLGADILDDNSDPIILQTETANAVGEGTDVDLNLNVDVYAYYGGYEQLLDEFSNPILDEYSDPILVQFGFPNGRRVYSGYIADYELVYGQQTGVNVKLVPHATEMSHYIFKDGLNTTVSYLNYDPVQMARDAMENYTAQGGSISWSEATMPLSGESVDYDFKLQTTRESVDKTIDLLPTGWYHYAHPGENLQYLLSKGEEADHIFYYEKHLSDLKLRKSITQLVNKAYFVGGEVAGSPLFKYNEDLTSVSNYRPGLIRMADSRVTLDDSADILMNRQIEEFKLPRYRTSVEITDAVYDIEDIRLGDMIAFKNFGTFADQLILQTVAVTRKKHSVTLDLDMTVPNEAKRLEELKKAILSEEIRDIADVPS